MSGKDEWSHVESAYQLGTHSLKIPMSLHALNRQKIVDRMKDKAPTGSIIVLEGGKTISRYDSDGEHLFRQESHFHYLFGVKEADFYGAINITSGESILFIPRLPESYGVWMGEILPPSYFKKLYSVSNVYYVDQMVEIFNGSDVSLIYTLYGKNLDSGMFTKDATFPGIENFKVNKSDLHYELCECRLIKTTMEQEVMRYISKVSSDAHVYVMKRVRPEMHEFQMESLFRHYIHYYGGCRNCAYTCICASGPNGAILHYGHAGSPNDRKIGDGEMLMFDMGGEYHCYCSDISRSYPSNGKYTPQQAELYGAVLLAQETVIKTIKPGVSWKEMHRLAERVILEKLVEYNFLIGSIEELVENYIGSLFMPHGLGHLLGLDTHDVGGYEFGMSRVQEPGLKSLRLGRLLEEGMILTVEPGLYFNSAIWNKEFNNPKITKYLNQDKIRQHFDFGGIRIEDVVIITKDGCEVISTAPKQIKEIEDIMAQGRNQNDSSV
jgi:Xaa-Pro dipeptidase